jgi:hypothetical protein
VNTLTLSRAELRELTGLSRPSAQVRWLASRSYSFERRADGSVSVARAHALAKLGVAADKHSAPKLSTEPNLEALNVTP